MKFKIPYYISDGGDGSANLMIMPSLDEAEREDAAQDPGWGESSAGTIDVELVNGQLIVGSYEPVTINQTED